MALIVVLWGVALLSVIATSFLTSGGTSYRIARQAIDVAQVDAIGEGAVARAVLALADARAEPRWRVDGSTQRIELFGLAIGISIQDELGRIDINHADGALLARVFRAAGLDEDGSARLTDKILDWRDTNPGRRLNGANAQDYRAAGYSHAPRKGAFQGVDELKLVMGMTPDLYRRVEPALTVYSGSQFFDQRVAPREALLALPGMDAAKVAAMLAARAQENVQGTVQPNVQMPAVSLAGRAFTIRSEIERPTGLQVREAVVRLTDDPARPYWVLNWKAR
jgi:general secretion pathway protein K